MARKSKKIELNDKQKRFCQEYLIDLNATQSAKRAGYSEKTAYSQGQRLLKHVVIQKEIILLQKKQEKRTEIEADKILLELARVAFAQITDFIDQGDKGISLKKLDELTDAQKACIAEVVEQPLEDGGSYSKIKLHSKLRALELLGRNKKLFTDIVEHAAKAELLAVLSGLGGGDSGS